MSKVRKGTKRVLAIIGIVVLSAMMLMTTMPMEAFAADAVATLKLSDNAGESPSAANGTFTAFPIITADHKVTAGFEGFFGNSQYGNYTFDGNEIKDSEGNVVKGVQSDVSKDSAAAKLAVALERYAAAKGLTGSDFQNNKATLAEGLYLVVETQSTSQSWTDANGVKHERIASRPMLVFMDGKDKTVTLKDSSTSLSKTVDNGKKATDVNIGDTVDFKIDTAVPVYEYDVQKVLDQKSLVFELNDTFSSGLDYVADPGVVVKAGGKVVEPSNYTVSYDDAARKLTIKFNYQWIIDNQGQNVTVEYKAKLNENAKVNDVAGNPNDVTLTFTHNPNQKDDHKTLEDKTKTFTYGFKIKKFDKNNASADMSGTKFELFTDKDCKTPAKVNGKNAEITIGSDNMGEINGLDEGTYYLKETPKSTDYSQIPTFQVVITAEKVDGVPTGKATISLVGAPDGSAIEQGQTVSDGDTFVLQFKVPNERGLSLPETGARTALMVMIIGAAIVAAGIVVMRKGKKEEPKA